MKLCFISEQEFSPKSNLIFGPDRAGRFLVSGAVAGWEDAIGGESGSEGEVGREGGREGLGSGGRVESEGESLTGADA